MLQQNPCRLVDIDGVYVDVYAAPQTLELRIQAPNHIKEQFEHARWW